MTIGKLLLEDISAIMHEAWQHWAETICKQENISEDRQDRWKKYFVPYDQLEDDVQEYDRKWARKVIGILAAHGYQKVTCHTCGLAVADNKIRYTCDACLAEVREMMTKSEKPKDPRCLALEEAIQAACQRLFNRKYPITRVVLPAELIALNPSLGCLPIVEGPEARVEAPSLYPDRPFEKVEGF